MKIVLIGFMGSGKTTVSKLLAEKTKSQLIEMDDEIVKNSGRRSVIEIFEKDGEAHFRKLETDLAKSLIESDSIIISSGGGVVTIPETIENLRKNSKTIFLETSFDEIAQRLEGDSTRPLFQNRELAKERFENRKSLYHKYADVIIQTDGKTPEAIISEIINEL